MCKFAISIKTVNTIHPRRCTRQILVQGNHVLSDRFFSLLEPAVSLKRRVKKLDMYLMQTS